MSRRLRVLYLVPGHDLVPTAGPTRNALSLAEAWSATAEITLAFRRVREAPRGSAFRVLELDPETATTNAPDDAAVRGMRVRDLFRYLRALRRFVERHAADYDVVLEKSWLLSGFLCARARRHGIPGAVVENIVRVYVPRVGTGGPLGDLAGRLRHRLVQGRVRRLLRHTHVLAETPELKDALVARLGLSAGKVAVVTLGVDHELFVPADRDTARAELGLGHEPLVALYFGALDRTHDLAPALRALAANDTGHICLHVLGDGERRQEYERIAGRAGSVVFHGRVPHAEVPRYIAASDLCLAPYDPACFPGGEVAYSTLKIPEAMACARTVASVPSGNVRRLIQHGRSGLLLDNEVEAWSKLFASPPPPETLRDMGTAARETVRDLTWTRTAQGYQAFCEGLRSD